MMTENTADIISTPPAPPPAPGWSTSNEREAAVGFKDEVVTVMKQLIGNSVHLKIFSIVGMAGLGKTTLARKVYDHPYIANHFYVRAWIYVSQVYNKRDLLLEILSSPHIEPSGDIHRMSDEKLIENLNKRLKEKTYLIVMDDMWNTGAWNDLSYHFPKDKVGSRIMFTSRYRDVALQAASNSILYDLSSLSNEESWVLLKDKVFQKELCPPKLEEVGKKIAKKCQGLPLAIVVVGGLLAKKEKIEYLWKEVAESIKSYIVSDPKQCIEILELSYDHLPLHLKLPFLYFGAFSEDCEIPVSRLIWLWMAEGFIEKHEEDFEDVAEGYLKDLIERCLIVVAKKRSDGAVKSCRVHDLLHDLCIIKAEEGNFLQQIGRYKQVSSTISSSLSYSTPSAPSSSTTDKLCRMSIRSGFRGYPPFMRSQNVCSLLCFEPLSSRGASISYQHFEFLRVLVLWHVILDSFPSIIEKLVQLRYLAIRVRFNELPPSLSNLQELETLIVKGIVGSIVIYADICRMTKLRHLHINPSASLKLHDNSLPLVDLQTISTQHFGHFDWSYFKSTPNLRKLRCFLSHYEHDPRFRKIKIPPKLEKLRMHYNGLARGICLFGIPSSLKQLTLSKFHFHWREILKLARLEHLEVLKLLTNAFDGDWLEDTNFEESSFKPFPKLTFLKFESLNIRRWKIDNDYFPCLQRLVLNRCKQLCEIPFDIGEISTLETIELNWYNTLAAQSAKKIEQYQQDEGKKLKILFYPPYCSSQHAFGDALSSE